MFTTDFFGDGLLIDTAALAAVALIGYIFGRRTRPTQGPQDGKLLDELARAQLIAAQLEHLASRVAAEAPGLRESLLAYVRSLGGAAGGGRIDADVVTAMLLLLTAAPEYQLC